MKPFKRCARLRPLLLVAGFSLLALGQTVGSDELLKMKVSPVMSLAPALVTVQAVVDSSDDNRGLQVIADSGDFYTSSQVLLNGAKGPRLNVVQFRNLPSGRYELTGILIGAQGQRAAAT